LANRRKSREFALQVLFQLDMTKQDALQVFAQMKEHFTKKEENHEFAERIIKGIVEHSKEIDQLIEKFSENWRIDRMSIIDRNILRMALFELLYCEDIPPKVTLNEAIDLGKRFGSGESGSFINGLLDRIQNEVVRKPIE
jgi:N utilization substance protein B